MDFFFFFLGGGGGGVYKFATWCPDFHVDVPSLINVNETIKPAALPHCRMWALDIVRSRRSGRDPMERFVKTLRKRIKAAKAEGGNWRKEMQAILRNYRTSCNIWICTCRIAAEKRPVCNKLPQANHADPVSEIICKHNSSQKSKIKAHVGSNKYIDLAKPKSGAPI